MKATKRKILATVITLGLLMLTFGAAQSASEDPRIAAARQEGELSWIDSIVVPGSAVKLAEAFKKRYGLPDLKVNHQRKGTGKVAKIITEELRANKVTIDVFALASPRLYYSLLKAKELGEYSSPNSKYYLKNIKKAGLTFEPGYWISPVAYVMAPLTNPKFYSKKIKSWNDLLDPQLKGRKIDYMNVHTSESSLYNYYGVRKVMPLSFFEKLAAQEPIFSASSVDRTRNLTTGETLLAVTSVFRQYQTKRKTGVALQAFFPEEGVPLFGQPYGILAKAPHPNAASLFIDFILSEEGHKMYIDLEATISAREGFKVPENIKPFSPPITEINTIPIDWKGLGSATLRKYRNEFKKTFKK